MRASLAVLAWLWIGSAFAQSALIPSAPPTSCTIASCNIGAATGTSLALGGATLGTSSLVVPAGNAAAPSLAIGNSTTGLYSVSTTGFGLSVNGSDKLNFGVTNSGVWTTTAGVTASGTANFIGNGVQGNFVGVNAANVAQFTAYGSQTSSRRSSLLFASNFSGTPTKEFEFGIDVAQSGTSNFYIYSDVVGATRLLINSTPQIYIGGGDVAAPVAQTLGVPSVVAGTSNTAGANRTEIGSLSTGSGVSGDFIIQTGGTGAAATVQNAAVTAVAFKGATQQANFGGIINPANAFTPTSGSGAASVAGNDQRFVVTAGTAQTSITVNFGHTWAAAPICTISTNSTASVVDIASISTSAVTFGASVALTGALINALCFGS